MTPYSGRHAELYDLFYADKPYAREASFVHSCLQRAADGRCRSLLDVACGTGRHAFEFEKLGYEVVGADQSPDMLARGREKAAEIGSTVKFHVAEMSELSLPGQQTFDAVTCLFDSIGFVRDTDAVRAALRAIGRQLRPGGLLALEFWHGPAFIRHFDPIRVRRWNGPRGQILRISETEVDYRQQLGIVTYTVLELESDGTYSSFVEKQVNRFFHVTEMSDYLESSGFSPIRWHAGFSEEERLADDVWHVVALARRGAQTRS